MVAGMGEKACFVDSGWTFRPLKRPRPGMTGMDVRGRWNDGVVVDSGWAFRAPKRRFSPE